MPFIDHPVVWYGVLFALGFLAAYFLGGRVFLYESLGNSSLTKEWVADERELLKLCQKHPRLFPKEKLHIEEIIPLLDKYIKTKTLPISFFSSKRLRIKEKAMEIADRLTTFLVLGLVVGARLGYVFFYGWPAFRAHPLDIIKIWEGGLASHGGCIGVLIALFWVVYRQSKTALKITFLQILDILALICGVIAFFIRLGNFINQEIVGIPTQKPWGIIFQNPLAGESVVPRHPVQLYEALFYLGIALLSYTLWKKNWVKIGSGRLTGIVLSTLFLFRFFIEFLKEHQGVVLDSGSYLQMGQVLSLPFILIGLGLILRPIWIQKQQRMKSLSKPS